MVIFICRVGRFHAERNLESVCFTNDNHFVLISINAIKKPAQLCLLDNDDVIDGLREEERFLKELGKDKNIYGDELKISDLNPPKK